MNKCKDCKNWLVNSIGTIEGKGYVCDAIDTVDPICYSEWDGRIITCAEFGCILWESKGD